MTDFPDLKIKALVNFPADVIGGAGVDVNNINGRYHLGLGYGDFMPPITGVVDATNETVVTWNTATEEYKLASISVLASSVTEFLALTGVESYLSMRKWSGVQDYGPWIYAAMARGTADVPAAVQPGDQPFGIVVYGYDGVGAVDGFFSSSIHAVVDGPVSANVVPIAWVITTGNQDVGDGTERLRVGSDGTLTHSGAASVHVATQPYSHWTAWSGASPLGPRIYSVMTRGTSGAQTAVQSGDQPFGIPVYGHDGTATRNTASFYAEVDGAVSDGVVPVGWTIATGTTEANQAARLRVTSAGHSIFSPGSTTPPTLTANGNFNLTPTSNTTMRINYRGSDGVTRHVDLTLVP